MESLNEIKRDSLRAFLLQGKRSDNRGMLDFRPITVQPGILQNAEGSAMASIGKSQVMVGVNST